MVGITGSPGVRNAREFRFEGCLEMTRSINNIDSIRKMKIKLKNDPLNPIASIKSMKKMHMYIKPTSFVTNIPKTVEIEIKNLISQLQAAYQFLLLQGRDLSTGRNPDRDMHTLVTFYLQNLVQELRMEWC